MRPAEVVRRAGDYLDRHDVQSPVPTAELLLASVLHTDRAGLYARSEGLSTAEAKAFGRVLCRRCAGVPLQHLTGRQGFRRLELVVRPGVFIPRPETEILVEAALEAIAAIPEPIVVDVGTGSGAVAVAIAQEHPTARVLATDIAEDAVALAGENARGAGVEVVTLCGDLLTPLPEPLRGRIDLVVANPPYVGEDERGTLPPEVLAEPEEAVFSDPGIYDRLARQSGTWLRPGGTIAVEIGSSLGPVVTRMLASAGFGEPVVRRDLNGLERVVVARWP